MGRGSQRRRWTLCRNCIGVVEPGETCVCFSDEAPDLIEVCPVTELGERQPPVSRELITAGDLHEAAGSDLMNPEADPAVDPVPVEALGLDPVAVPLFARESHFSYPMPGGIPHNLDPGTLAYGICLGLTAARRKWAL